jgi:hypothetical protein
MPHQCSVCALPLDIRSHGEDLILKGKEYREVVLLSPNGPSKSSWHRHMQGCFRRRKFYGVGRRHADKEERLVTQFADGTFWLDGQPFDGKFRESDVLLRIVYQETDVRKLGNPSALITPDLLNEAYAEDRERFPAEEKNLVSGEDISQTSNIVARTSSAGPAEPCEEMAEPLPVTITNAVLVEPTPPCAHDWKDIAAGIKRCQQCGEQQNSFQPVGVSRKWWNEKHGAGRNRFGRFG